MKFYKDGVLSASETNFNSGHKIRSGGSLVLGQSQDSLASVLNSAQSFQGFLSNFNVWDYVLCEEIISRMSKVCLLGEGNVYKWSYFLHGVMGDPRLFLPSPCAPPGKRIMFRNDSCVRAGFQLSVVLSEIQSHYSDDTVTI